MREFGDIMRKSILFRVDAAIAGAVFPNNIQKLERHGNDIGSWRVFLWCAGKLFGIRL